MIPHAEQALELLAQRLTSTLIPNLKTAYSQADAMLTTQLMRALGAELGYGIERRMQDVRAIQQLFDRVASLLNNSLTLEAVDAVHDQLTAALVALHEKVDLAESERVNSKISEANQRSINDMIWSYLDAHAARHQMSD
jgi:hypothetical protein